MSKPSIDYAKNLFEEIMTYSGSYDDALERLVEALEEEYQAGFDDGYEQGTDDTLEEVGQT
jgi:flagellar biosynthesis/type III secretory pathway protein FliH